MKILQLIQKPQNRGAETFACQLSRHLVKMGYQVKILAVFKGEVTLDWDEKIEDIRGSAVNRFLDYKAWKTLAEHVKEFQPDLVQANAGDTLKYAVFSKKVFGWRQPIIFRNASEVGRYLTSGIQKKLNRFFYKNVNQVLSVSQASQIDIVSLFPFLKERTIVIPVGLEEKTPRTLELLPKGVPQMVHIGGFSFEKNHKGLLEILELVLEHKPNLHLHLVGDGPLRQEIEALVEKKNLDQKITFHGFVNNPLDYGKSADVLVLPSIIEGLPGVLLEAMYCKTPVVAYDVGGISEILNKDTGALIQEGDQENFARAVVKVLQDRPDDKIEAAYKMVKEHYMNKQIAQEFVKSYQRLVAKKE